MAKPNLTHTRWISNLERQKRNALLAVPAHEVVQTAVYKTANGKRVLENGLPVITEVKALKRDVVAKEYDETIASAKAAFGLK